MKHLLSAADKKLVETAVGEAEKLTSGEIVPVVAEASGDYSFVAHRLGLGGLVLFSALIWFLPHSQSWFWEFSAVLAAQAVGWSLGYAIGQVPAVIRLMAGKKRLDSEVHHSSLASFLLNDLHHTAARNGILVYISLLEHRVEILADEGIHRVAGEEFWQKETKQIAAGIASGQPGKVLAEVIREIGAKLAEHFPVQAGDRNELPNFVRDR